MPIINRFADLQQEITAWRRELHAYPELLFDVDKTAAFAASNGSVVQISNPAVVQ